MVAGLCVAGLLLPEAVAYAGLAHLPVMHALVAMMTGLAVYAAFGGSRFAIVAPTSSTATLSAAAVVSLPGLAGGSDVTGDYAQALMGLVLLAGGFLMLLAWARQGQLAAFVSRPVLRGFAFALALTIVIRQLPDALGLTLPAQAGSGSPLQVLRFAVLNPALWHLPSVLVAIASALALAGLRRWPQWPGSLLVIVLAVGLSWGADLPGWGVQVVGAVTQSALGLAWPDLPADRWLRLAELAVGLVVLVFSESWGSMRAAALAHGDRISANRELMVLGGCNALSALCQGMAVGAGFSATAANVAAGAMSRRAGLVAFAAALPVLLFALPALAFLPRPVLAVAVIGALWHALSLRPLRATWRMNRDRALVIGAVVAVFLFGVLDGMLTAIALSLLGALRRFSLPVVRELGELDRTRNFIALDAHPEVVTRPAVLVLRPESPLFFACAEQVANDVHDRALARPGTRAVVLSLEESADLDSTAAECLVELNRRLAGRGLLLILARVKEPVRELLIGLDPQALGTDERMSWSVADAVLALDARFGR